MWHFIAGVALTILALNPWNTWSALPGSPIESFTTGNVSDGEALSVIHTPPTFQSSTKQPILPAVVIYTFAVVQDGSGDSDLDKPKHDWQVHCLKGLNLWWVARMAEIPFTFPLVKYRKQMVIFGWYWNNKFWFQDPYEDGSRPALFEELPGKVQEKFGENVTVEFSKYSWQILEAWDSSSPDQQFKDVVLNRAQMLARGQITAYEDIERAMASKRLRE